MNSWLLEKVFFLLNRCGVESDAKNVVAGIEFKADFLGIAGPIIFDC